MTEKTERECCLLGGLAFLMYLIAVALSSCTGYSQCLHNSGGAFRCTISSRQINQTARANILTACSEGNELACQKGCGQMHDQEICDTWLAIKCPRDPSIANPRVILNMTVSRVAELVRLETKPLAST
jgi:hypothetical protein